MLQIREQIGGKTCRYAVHTFGCQQNEADSEHIRGMLERMGYIRTFSNDDADVIVINTCAVREHAESKVFGVIGELKHSKAANPGLAVAVCGCMAQRPGIAERIRESYRHVDIVFGTHALWRFPELLYTALSDRRRVFSVEDSEGEIAEGLPVSRDRVHSAWLTVMHGCNNFCSYCIVPYTRGRERSREPETVVSEAKKLIASGARDITLLGQNVNSYGKSEAHGVRFPGLLRKLGELRGDFLIRFMTSHPKDAGAELFDAMASSEKIARHIHLPFQAGSDRVLKMMNRGYARDHYLKLIETAREKMPDIVITSDVIVGFPGETEEEFEETYSLIERVRFDALFTFIHSPRPGTPSSKLDDPVSREAKQVRFDRMIKLQNRISAELHEEYIGKTVRVLVTDEADDPVFPLTGRTNGGRLVKLRGGVPGEFSNVKITGRSTWSLLGEIV
ncbi:MAG: tRNA (N6-isopentenyl adenosine(37)-C2)-methylthiotransferase MiaB [Clostridiales bacterium]|nr:tRNA (N6-isopentenyl adenosine(37)-C2)-methylthiotransferase MiaB [Clostridiales bacterium]